jgi:hypothetical protein
MEFIRKFADLFRYVVSIRERQAWQVAAVLRVPNSRVGSSQRVSNRGRFGNETDYRPRTTIW